MNSKYNADGNVVLYGKVQREPRPVLVQGLSKKQHEPAIKLNDRLIPMDQIIASKMDSFGYAKIIVSEEFAKRIKMLPVVKHTKKALKAKKIAAATAAYGPMKIVSRLAQMMQQREEQVVAEVA